MQVGRQRRLTHKRKVIGCVCFCCHEAHSVDKSMWRRAVRHRQKTQDRVAQGGLTTLKLSMLYN